MWMDRRKNMLMTLKCKPTEQIPVTPHWWGLYKFELAGHIDDYYSEAAAWDIYGEELADVDSVFYEEFKPDMLHLSTSASKIKDSDAVRKEKDRILKAVRSLESYSVIDEYIQANYPDKEEVIKSGVFDHVRILSDRYGQESVLMLNEGNPICWILDPDGCVGFEDGLIAMLEKPDKMEYLIHRSYEALLPRIVALKEMGADGYIGSETYCSADIMSPKLYHDLIFEAQKKFYNELCKIGLIPVTYFTGDIIPLLDDIKELGVKGLMVEESKKSFTLDIASIYERLEGQVCLFGNLDSVYALQLGTVDDVICETRRQISACNRGGFIMANGCPISFDTPAENIHAMIDTVRREGNIKG
jgi:uroporphyrinogen-III decarboxylase